MEKKVCPRCGEPMSYHMNTYKVFANDYSGAFIINTDEYYECHKCGMVTDFVVNRSDVMATDDM